MGLQPELRCRILSPSGCLLLHRLLASPGAGGSWKLWSIVLLKIVVIEVDLLCRANSKSELVVAPARRLLLLHLWLLHVVALILPPVQSRCLVLLLLRLSPTCSRLPLVLIGSEIESCLPKTSNIVVGRLHCITRSLPPCELRSPHR